jgi:hypothetical protein
MTGLQFKSIYRTRLLRNVQLLKYENVGRPKVRRQSSLFSAGQIKINKASLFTNVSWSTMPSYLIYAHFCAQKSDRNFETIDIGQSGRQAVLPEKGISISRCNLLAKISGWTRVSIEKMHY